VQGKEGKRKAKLRGHCIPHYRDLETIFAKKVAKGNHAMVLGDKPTKKEGGPSTSKASMRKHEDESDEDMDASGENEPVDLL
jgi:hypothetical protein